MDADGQHLGAGRPRRQRPKIAAAAAAVCTGGVLGAAGVLSVSSAGTGGSRTVPAAGAAQAVSDTTGSRAASSSVAGTVTGGVVDIVTTLGYQQATRPAPA